MSTPSYNDLKEKLKAKELRLMDLKLYATNLRTQRDNPPPVGEIADRIDQLAWGVGVYYPPDGQ